MRESPDRKGSGEGVLAPGSGESSTPRYTLERAAVVETGGLAFSILYSSSLSDCLLTLYGSGGGIIKRVSLPPTGELAFRALVPIQAGEKIEGFELSSEAHEGSLRMRAAGIAPDIGGFRLEDKTLTLDTELTDLKISPDSVEVSFSDAARRDAFGGRWLMKLELAFPDSSRRSEIRITGSNASDSVAFVTGSGSVYLPEGAVGFVPREASIKREAAEPLGEMPSLGSLLLSRIEGDSPIPADPGIILNYRMSAWRRKDFEVFSWSRYPSVLIFDTADYGVQDGMFKRLAFFVEKAGYRGTIPEPRAIEARHGYNAHDYRAEDLARFYSEALSAGVPLTPGESELKRILLENGVMRAKDSRYLPVEGAVLSISRESAAPLRRLLLTHECFHGVFFSSAEFREECRKAWGDLSETERRVWLLFFDYGAYDASDSYLAVNESQAYVLQQEREKVGEYQAIVLSRLRRRFPDQGPLLDRFLLEHSDSFTVFFDRLNGALRRCGGPAGGEAIAVEERTSR